MSEILSSICDLSILYWFNRRYTMRHYKTVRIIISFLIVLGIAYAEKYLQVENLGMLAGTILVMYTVIFLISYREKKKIVFGRSIAIASSVMIGEILIALVIMLLTVNYDFKRILEVQNFRWGVIYLSAKVFECFILNIINKIMDYKSGEGSRKIVAWNIVFLGGTLVCLYLYLDNICRTNDKAVMEQTFFIQLLILGVLLFAYLNIMNNYYRMNREKMELENIFNEMRREAEYYEQTNALHEEIRKIKHDLKNFEILAETKDLKDIDEYFAKFNNYVNSGNRILDLLIMNKIKVCKEKKIDFKCQLTSQDLNWLNALDIISIFGNIIDNAIEACEKTIEKEIKLSSWKTNGCIVIKVENPVAEIIVQHNKFITTKRDKKNHGLGLKCLKEALKRYEGTYEISVEGQLFQVIICIPLANMANYTQK